jgi:HEPN domain-containing protein
MVEELRKVELVRDRLESLQQLVGSYPEGHETRALLENLHLDRAIQAVEKDIGALREALLYPRGT